MSEFPGGSVAIVERPSSELITRIRELRRRMLAPAASTGPQDRSLQRQLNDLRAQVSHLEQLLQGLQDSVYRDARRHDDRISEIQERIEPAAIAASLSTDARDRGL